MPDLSACTFAVLYGAISGETLIAKCNELKNMQVWPVVAYDAIYPCKTLAGALCRLDEDLVQIVTTAGIAACVESGRQFIYPFSRPDCTATICLLFDGGTQALVVKRLHNPEKGKNAFPGGFMRAYLETMEECAYRELAEESGLKMLPGELILVDIRSAPGRDPRSHIVDAGYAALVSNIRKAELMSQLKAGDDASDARLEPVAELLAGELAFDHHQLLLTSLQRFNLVSACQQHT